MPGNGEELDANGVSMERVDVFNARSTPVSHRCGEDEWTDEQMDALVEGLETYASKTSPLPRSASGAMLNLRPDPNDPCSVFQQIFRKYCGRHGPLRHYNVQEITSQAAYVRTTIMDTCRRNGWSVQDWVKEIPVILPP